MRAIKMLLKETLRSSARALKESKLYHSVVGGPPRVNDLPVSGSFEDSRGNSLTMFAGYRDAVRPSWRSMFAPPSTSMPEATVVKAKVIAARRSVRELADMARLHGIPLLGSKVLEVGCFDGVRSSALREAGAGHVTGSDIAAYYILQQVDGEISEEAKRAQNDRLAGLRQLYAEAQGGGDGLDFIEDSITESKLNSASFDLICSWEVLEHVTDPAAMFKQLHRLLKPGGMSVHEYNPFFCMEGGHSLCTLDIPWGHARLDDADVQRYLKRFRPDEIDIATRFFRHNLNRMTFSDLNRYSLAAGLQVLAIIPMPQRHYLRSLTPEIISQARALYPTLTTNDLISPVVWVVLRRPA